MKATQVAARVAAEHPGVTWWCPQLPPSPREAMDLITQGTADWPRAGVAVVGSSLGGFYAMYLADKYNLPVVLINPSMAPGFTLQKRVGQAVNFHDFSSYEWNEAHVQSLEKYQCSFSGQRCLLLLQTGDDVLDYKLAVDKLPDAHHVIEQGGNHGFEGFERYLSNTITHLNFAP